MTPGRVRIGEDAGRRVLLVDNVVQSIASADEVELRDGGYWRAMLPDNRPEQALLLGLGAGSIARLLHSRFGPVHIIAVDCDPNVADMAESELANLPGLLIVVDDAFCFVQRCDDRFDYICVDLYRGAQMERGVVQRPFLRRLRALLLSRGQLVFNLFADRRTLTRIQRISRVFRVTRQVAIEKNVVVWAH